MQCEKCNKKIYANETCECGQKAPKKNNGGVGANSVICFILLMISATCLILTLSLRTVVNKNTLVKVIEDVELAELKVDDGKKLDQYIYDEYIDDERITIENVDNVLEDPFIKDFLIEKVNAYQDFALDKGDTPYITADEVVKLIEDNEELLYNEAGLRFLEPDKAELRDDLSDLNDFERFSRNFLDTSFGSKLVQTFFSYANVIFLIVLMLVIFIQWIIVYKANARRAAKMLSKYGVALIISSGYILLPAFVSVIAMKVLSALDIMDKMLMSATIPFIVYSAIILAIGIIITVISARTNKKYKTRNLVGEIGNDSMPTIATENLEVPVSTPVNENVSNNLETPVSMPVAESSVDNLEAPVSTPVTESAEKMSKSNICSKCTHQNKESAAFCSRCGNKLK